jgi:beta-N-acetylhexosaminidase
VRRRRGWLAAGAGVAFATGAALGAAGGSGAPERPRAPVAAREAAAERERRAAVDRLALEQQVGRLVVLRFRGTRAPGYVRRRLRRGEVAGAILFRDNVTGPGQLRALTGQLRRAAGDTTPLICVDQEGGDIRILPWAAPERSAALQAAAGTVRADSRAAAGDLRAAGVNVTLAPVADVPSVVGAALAGRAFRPDFESAATAVAESVRGWREGGVAPTLKHFPGLGGSKVNTDFGPATVERDGTLLRAEDVAPFRAGIEAGAPLVMVGHARYPALDADRIASQSIAVVDGLLRDELGFDGVAITDSTEAAAVQEVSDVEVAALRNVAAGIDVVLTTGRGSYIRVYRALLAEARRSPAFRERVRESASRVLALQGGLR